MTYTGQPSPSVRPPIVILSTRPRSPRVRRSRSRCGHRLQLRELANFAHRQPSIVGVAAVAEIGRARTTAVGRHVIGAIPERMTWLDDEVVVVLDGIRRL